MRLFKKNLNRLYITTLLHIIETEFKNRGLLVDNHFEVYGIESETEIINNIEHALEVWGIRYKKQ